MLNIHVGGAGEAKISREISVCARSDPPSLSCMTAQSANHSTTTHPRDLLISGRLAMRRLLSFIRRLCFLLLLLTCFSVMSPKRRCGGLCVYPYSLCALLNLYSAVRSSFLFSLSICICRGAGVTKYTCFLFVFGYSSLFPPSFVSRFSSASPSIPIHLLVPAFISSLTSFSPPSFLYFLHSPTTSISLFHSFPYFLYFHTTVIYLLTSFSS